MGNKETKSDTVELISHEASEANNGDVLLDDPEEISIIWYSTSGYIPAIKESLLKINNYIRFISSDHECLDFIKTTKAEKIFLIISSNICQDLLNEFNSFDAIHSIFIYSAANEIIINTAPKIVGIYTCVFDLIKSIRKTIRLCEKQQGAFSLFDQQQKNVKYLTQESGSFLFFQLFKDVILNMQRTPESKMEMIEHCKVLCHQNEERLKNIEEFNKAYKSTEAIHWYTRDSFVYRLVNKALRTEDIEALYTFRFFIADLCTNLHSKYNILKKQEPILKLYRGMMLSTDEIQRLEGNIGKLMVQNGFLSSSRCRSVALEFAKKSTKREAQSVLFEIDVDFNIANKIVAADVAKFSDFKDEKEVLFDLDASFKIDSCSYDSLNRLWLIKITATNEGIDLASNYVDYHKKKVAHSDIVLMFGHLLAEMGQSVKSEKYFQSILRQRPNDEGIACIYHNMGRVHRLKDEYDRALDSYHRSYEMHLLAQPQRLVSAAKCLNGIGIVYNELHKYDLAVEHLTRALKIYEESLSKHHSEIAGALNNLANVYQNKGDYDRALEHLQRAKHINDRTLPLTHPNHATTLNNTGNVYFKKADYSRALNNYTEALEIRKKVLPSDHIDILRTHDNIGIVYYATNDYVKALEHFKKAQELSEKTLAETNVIFIQIKAHVDLANEKCKK